MRTFDYKKFENSVWDNEILGYIGQIHEYKGRQNLYLSQRPQELKRLVEIAKIQSTESSNKLEGIVTTATRIKQLLLEKTTPRTRSETEILGYRDVLKTIHENYEYIPLKPSYILQLHRDLYSYSEKTMGGKYKSVQNYISAKTSDGKTYTLFTPLAPYETAAAIESICLNYNSSVENIDTLLMIPIFISDFLCIHPFLDGNGRMSRLLTTLLLYRSGYHVGKYISLEKIIERTKENYYDALRMVSEKWHEGTNEYEPFIKYFLGIVLKAYRELESRISLVERNLPAYETVKEAVGEMIGTFSKNDILERCPKFGSSSVEAALKRLREEEIISSTGTGKKTRYFCKK